MVRDKATGLAAYRPYADDPRPRRAARKVVGRLDMLSHSQTGGAVQGGDKKAPIGSVPFGQGSIGKMPEQKGRKKMLYELR